MEHKRAITMEIIRDLAEISKPFDNAVVTIGNFDGVHIGHQALFRQVIEKARNIKGTSVVMTFEPHPIRVLNCHKHFPLITLYEQKAELIGATGIDKLVCVPFTREFAAIPARTFVKEILCDLIGMKCVVVGEDYSFGKNRQGDIRLLKELGRAYGFEVIISGWIELGARRISSTEIRNLVRGGQLEEAARLLGRHYQVRGTVKRGRDRGGKLLGYPTANLTLYDELCPKGGVYAVSVEYERRAYEGVANIGYSPTFDNGEFSVEVHILDFNDDIYDRPIRVNFIQRLRGEKKFATPKALAAQIKLDIEKARKLLNVTK
jgi:riboflavin kinase/FMN adenylyltransferase